MGYLTRGLTMLVLTRGLNERIMIGDDVEVRVVRVDGDQVRLGITAPLHVLVDRAEVRRKRGQRASRSSNHDSRAADDE